MRIAWEACFWAASPCTPSSRRDVVRGAYAGISFRRVAQKRPAICQTSLNTMSDSDLTSSRLLLSRGETEGSERDRAREGGQADGREDGALSLRTWSFDCDSAVSNWRPADICDVMISGSTYKQATS